MRLGLKWGSGLDHITLLKRSLSLNTEIFCIWDKPGNSCEATLPVHPLLQPERFILSCEKQMDSSNPPRWHANNFQSLYRCHHQSSLKALSLELLSCTHYRKDIESVMGLDVSKWICLFCGVKQLPISQLSKTWRGSALPICINY